MCELLQKCVVSSLLTVLPKFSKNVKTPYSQTVPFLVFTSNLTEENEEAVLHNNEFNPCHILVTAAIV